MEVDKIAHSSASWIVFLTKYFLHKQIKENEVGEACDAYRGLKSSTQGFGGET
jgi:hypothetical protein